MDTMLAKTLAVPNLAKSGGQPVTAKKDRTRLTVYVDAPVFDRFINEATAKYRTLSDHMNAILAEHYAKQNEAKSKPVTSEGGDGS